MGILVVILFIAVICFGGVLVLYARELCRITRFLRMRSPESNVELAMGVPLPGLTRLVGAIDEGLAAERARERDRRIADQNFQAGLTGLSHDIRTPLAGARGYLQLAAEESDDKVRAAYLAAAHDRLDAMQELLDQLFAFTRSQSASSPDVDEVVDAAAVLAEVLLGNLPVFEACEKEPEVDLGEGSLVVVAGEEDLRRIFDNALSNMLKYGSAPLAIRRQERTLIFSNGVLDAHAIDIERVFDRFYRADPARSETGAGLGLAVVKNLSERYDIEALARLEADHIFVLEFRFPSSERM